MIKYFTKDEFNAAKAQRNKTLAIFLAITGVFAAGFITLFIIYFGMPFKSPEITKLKIINHSIAAVYVVFSFIYLGIPYKRVRRYYKFTYNLFYGLKETSTAVFLENNDELHDKDGVDCKSLVFLEWNKYKKEYYERQVLVFYEKPFPDIPEKAEVRFVTQGNFLIEYELIEENGEEK